MPDEITKTPEQLAEEAAILAHCIADPQAWIDNALANNLPNAIPEKIEKYRQDYLSEKYLSITTDPETGIETRIDNPDYKTRAERDAEEEAKRSPLYGKTAEEIAAIQAEQYREKLKALRTTAVNSIVVTTSTGKAFDGDEISQSRMSRVVTAMMLAGVTDGIWTLANNETVPVTLAELQEAIVLSVQQMAVAWPLDQYEAVLDPLSIFNGITPPENPVDPNDLLGQLP